MNYISYIKYLFIYILALTIIIYLPIFFFYPDLKNIIIYTSALFASLTVITYPFYFRALSKSIGVLMGYIFGGMAFKIIVSLIAVVIMTRYFEHQLFEFVISFMITYILFTGFEIYCLLYNFAPLFKKKNVKNEG